MNKYLNLLFCCTLLFLGCEEEPVQSYGIPVGTTPFSPDEEAFLPYQSGNLIYRLAPDYLEEITFEFQEALVPKNAYAWKEVKYRYSTDYGFQVSFRLRYHLSEVAPEKTLAIYLPYLEENGEYGQVLFETPIDSSRIEEGFFKEKVIYHNEIELEGVIYNEVFEILPLTLDEGDINTNTYFNKVYYNRTLGLIQANQKNGNRWTIQP